MVWTSKWFCPRCYFSHTTVWWYFVLFGILFWFHYSMFLLPSFPPYQLDLKIMMRKTTSLFLELAYITILLNLCFHLISTNRIEFISRSGCDLPQSPSCSGCSMWICWMNELLICSVANMKLCFQFLVIALLDLAAYFLVGLVIFNRNKNLNFSFHFWRLRLCSLWFHLSDS